MRTMILILAGASAFVFGAAPAFAQDSEHSFTGPRAEANAGYDVTHSDDGIASTPNSLEALRVGGAVGYDVAIGNSFTIGAEAGFGFDIAGNTEYQPGATQYRLTGGRDLDASVRVGAKVTPSTLLFVKGGYANSQFRLRAKTGSTIVEDHTNEDGWRVGVGVEQMINDHIYAKAEYRYTDYGDDVNRHQALIGLGYRF